MIVQRTGMVLVLVLAFALIGWFVSQMMTQTIPAGHVGILFSAQNGIEKDSHGQVRVFPPRRLLVPPMVQLYLYPTLTQAAIYSQDTTWGEDKSADGVQVTTSDNAQNMFDVIVYYRVLPQDVGLVFKTFGAIPIMDIQTLHIRRAVKEVVNVVGPQHDAFKLMGEDRKAAAATLVTELRQRLKPKGITIEKAYFLQAYPQLPMLAKITNRVNAFTQLTIAGINNQIATKEKRIAIVKAQASAKASRLASAQTQAKSFEFLRLKAQREAIEKWGGSLPPIQAKAGQTLLIPPGLMSQLTAGTSPEAPAAPAEGGQ